MYISQMIGNEQAYIQFMWISREIFDQLNKIIKTNS